MKDQLFKYQCSLEKIIVGSFPTPAIKLTQPEIDKALDQPNLARSRAARALVGENPTKLERDFILAMDNPRPLYVVFRHAGADHLSAFIRLGGLGSGITGGTGIHAGDFTYAGRSATIG